MRPEIEARLATLPALDRRNLWLHTARCKVCRSRTRFFDVVDFNKHCSFENPYAFGASGICVPYYQCRACRLLFTDFFDSWTHDEFSRFIYNPDYIKVDSEYQTVRPAREAATMASRLRACESARVLDYGSGTGAFSREMRNSGFTRIESYDPFSSPERPQGRFDIITCFEVIEHSPNPIEAVQDMQSFLSEGGCIIFSQTLQPADIATQRGNWWYLGPRNGHICTFAAETLAVIGDAVGLVFHFWHDHYVFAAPVGSPVVASLLSGTAEAVGYLRLYAPTDPSSPDWHPCEQAEAGAFRWSRVAELEWPLPPLRKTPCRLRIAVPVIAAVSEDFASGCRVRLGDQILPAQCRGQELAAEVLLTGQPPRTVSLLTPEPSSPRTRGVADDRLLGLAVETLD